MPSFLIHSSLAQTKFYFSCDALLSLLCHWSSPNCIQFQCYWVPMGITYSLIYILRGSRNFLSPWALAYCCTYYGSLIRVERMPKSPTLYIMQISTARTMNQEAKTLENRQLYVEPGSLTQFSRSCYRVSLKTGVLLACAFKKLKTSAMVLSFPSLAPSTNTTEG